MAIFPKCDHLKACLISNCFMGCLSEQFVFEGNKTLKKLYSTYSKLILAYFAFYVARLSTRLVIMLNSEDSEMNSVLSNMSMTLICSVTVGRQLIMRLNPSFKRIIKLIIEGEKRSSWTDDQKLLEIYNACAKDTNQKVKLYMFLIFAFTVELIIRPMFEQPLQLQVGNETVYIRHLPLPIWIPLDSQLYYWTAYVWESIDTLLAVIFVPGTDMYMFCLIVYPTGQLKMMHHKLKNFEHFKQKYQKVDDDTAAYLTFVNIIEKHREVIEYVDCFNTSMGSLMVFDFLQSSLQIASIVMQITTNSLTLMLIFYVTTFFTSMVGRLIMYYYYANEVMTLSEDLATSAWESNWYEQSRTVKFMVLIFMKRSQKSLKFYIGAFGIISLNSFFSILKATYSYIMLMYGVNK